MKAKLANSKNDIPCMTHTSNLSNIPFSGTNEYHLLILRSHTPSHTINASSIPPLSSLTLMVPEMEKPRVTEIQVRMDCNGCVQKIKKALHGINVVGWADPEKIMKAIKKTRKIATICIHEPSEPQIQPTEPAPEGAPPAGDAANPPPESPPAESAPPTEPPKDPPPPENPPPEVTAAPVPTDNPSQPPQPSRPKDVEEIHVIHHHQDYSYGYNGQWNNHHNNHGYWNSSPNGHGFQPEPPVHVSHNYNTYRPSPYISEYEYGRSPPRQIHYNRMENYRDDYHNRDYHNRGNGDGNNITSMFSDENPNACSIV